MTSRFRLIVKRVIRPLIRRQCGPSILPPPCSLAAPLPQPLDRIAPRRRFRWLACDSAGTPPHEGSPASPAATTIPTPAAAPPTSPIYPRSPVSSADSIARRTTLLQTTGLPRPLSCSPDLCPDRKGAHHPDPADDATRTISRPSRRVAARETLDVPDVTPPRLRPSRTIRADGRRRTAAPVLPRPAARPATRRRASPPPAAGHSGRAGACTARSSLVRR